MQKVLESWRCHSWNTWKETSKGVLELDHSLIDQGHQQLWERTGKIHLRSRRRKIICWKLMSIIAWGRRGRRTIISLQIPILEVKKSELYSETAGKYPEWVLWRAPKWSSFNRGISETEGLLDSWFFFTSRGTYKILNLKTLGVEKISSKVKLIWSEYGSKTAFEDFQKGLSLCKTHKCHPLWHL